MPVLATTTVPLDISIYDRISAQLTPHLRAAAGFRAHAVYATAPGSFTVTEFWDRAEDHQAFFDSFVRPNLPDGTHTTVTDVHNILF